jgi:hypothetical protein
MALIFFDIQSREDEYVVNYLRFRAVLLGVWSGGGDCRTLSRVRGLLRT